MWEKNTKEYVKRVRTLKNLLDLYMLIIDLSEEDIIDNKINFNKIIFELLTLLLNKTDFVNKELFLHINKFFGNIFSTIVIQISTIKNN